MQFRLLTFLIVALCTGSAASAASAESILSNVWLGWGSGWLSAKTGGGHHDNEAGWSVISGYEINPYIAGEVGYLVSSGGSFTVSKPVTGGTEVSTIGGHSWNLSAVGSYPFNDTYSLFARVGLMTTSGNTVTTKGATVTTTDISGNEFYYGVGGAIAIGNGSMRLEYQRSNVIEQPVTYVTLSFVWKLRR